MHLLYPFAKRFIAGEDLPAVIQSLKVLDGLGFQSTVDYLGEHTLTEEQAEQSKREYLDLLREANQISQTMDFSIKLSQVGMEISPALCKRNVEELLKNAGRHTARFDMEGSETTQRAVDLCLELRQTYKNLGIALQAYLFRTQTDIETMIQNGISVRLCKGAYKEKSAIAYQSMDDIRGNFLKLAFLLLKEGAVPAVATHDEKLIREILKFIVREKIDSRSFYFEMLYGVRRDLQRFLLEQGYQTRIYVPYGKAWLPYTLRRLAERKENILFLVKSLFRETLGLRKVH